MRVLEHLLNLIARNYLSLIGIVLLIVLGKIGWNWLHRPAEEIPQNVYPYLLSIPTETVLLSHQEGKNGSLTAWAAILAIRTTLEPKDADALLKTARKPKTLKNLISNLPQEQQDEIKDKYKILTRYPFYEPGRYTFPCPKDVWFMDTFGAEREGGKRIHEGTDLFGPEGTPIYSVCSGVIEKLGWNRLGGERVGIRGDDGNYYYYAHLQAIHYELKVGMRVEKGDFLGNMGHTGDAITTPDHLHFGIELPNGEWINPYPFLSVWKYY